MKVQSVDFAIGSDDRVRRANEAALAASADLRAERAKVHELMAALKSEAHRLSVQITAVEKAAHERVQ